MKNFVSFFVFLDEPSIRWTRCLSKIRQRRQKHPRLSMREKKSSRVLKVVCLPENKEKKGERKDLLVLESPDWVWERNLKRQLALELQLISSSWIFRYHSGFRTKSRQRSWSPVISKGVCYEKLALTREENYSKRENTVVPSCSHLKNTWN